MKPIYAARSEKQTEHDKNLPIASISDSLKIMSFEMLDKKALGDSSDMYQYP